MGKLQVVESSANTSVLGQKPLSVRGLRPTLLTLFGWAALIVICYLWGLTYDNVAIKLEAPPLYGEFVTKVNGVLPLWMPIEQIFVTTITNKARNHSNTPRWGSSTWHDLWLAE